jgi:anaerobic C4-dicarboxylate transporter
LPHATSPDSSCRHRGRVSNGRSGPTSSSPPEVSHSATVACGPAEPLIQALRAISAIAEISAIAPDAPIAAEAPIAAIAMAAARVSQAIACVNHRRRGHGAALGSLLGMGSRPTIAAS